MLDKRKVHRLFEPEAGRQRLQEYVRSGDCYPFTAVLHTTMVCNHRCDFCNYFEVIDQKYEGGAKPTVRMETAYALRLLGELRECGVRSLILSGGGEPLLHPDFGRMAGRALELGFGTSLYTNLDVPLKKDALAAMPNFESVTVNINTSDPELYTRTRGVGADLERVEYNLGLLAERGVNLEAAVIVRDNTAPCLKATVAWLRERNVRRIKVCPAFELKYADGLSATDATVREMAAASREWEDCGEIRLLEPVEPSVRDESGRVVCRTSFFDITIGADYKVYPCCMTAYLDGYDIVDLRKYRSFREAWGSPERWCWLQGAELGCVTCWFAPANELLKSLESREKG